MDLKALEARIRRLEEHLGLTGDAQVVQLPAVAPIVERLVGYLNRTCGRRLQARAYADRVRKALRAGYTEAELRIVVWWAASGWKDDERMARHLNPDCLWKLKPGGASQRALPQYLSEAIELYEKTGRTFDRLRTFDA